MPLLHILLCSSLDTPPEPSPLFDVRVHASRRRTSPLVLTHPSLSARSRARFRHSLPFHAITPSRARAQCHCQRPRRPSSPPCLDSLRPEPHNLALCLLHPFPSSFEPTPGRIDLLSACIIGRHCLAAPELRPSVDLRPPVYLRPIQAVVSSAVTSSISPTPFPLPSGTALAGPQLRRRGGHAVPPTHAARRPRASLLGAAERLRAAELPSVLRRPIPWSSCPALAGTTTPPRAAAAPGLGAAAGRLRARPCAAPRAPSLRWPALTAARPGRAAGRPPPSGGSRTAAAVGREQHRRRAWPWPRPGARAGQKQGRGDGLGSLAGGALSSAPLFYILFPISFIIRLKTLKIPRKIWKNAKTTNQILLGFLGQDLQRKNT